MARPETRARLAYERSHLASAARGVAIAAGLAALAVGLHRTSSITWLVAGVLGISLATLGWRGGSWRRGAIAGVLAGLPPLVVPSLVFALSTGEHCANCATAPSLACLASCLGSSLVVGALVGRHALRDRDPSRFALAAFATAAATGLLGCATTGLGGAIGVIAGLAAGGVTGWRGIKSLGYPDA